MSGSTARALTLLELLEAHGRMGGAALAERLEVDMRTIRRYVMTLRDRGVPVEMERGRYGGYYLAAGYRRPLALTEREALSTAWGLLSIGRRSGGLAPGGDSERALAKLTQSLSQTTRSMIRDLEQVVTFADSPIPDGEPTDIGVEHLKTILFAVASRRRAQMVYRAWSGELTDRVVSPYHIVCRAGRWYVVGYCHLRRDQRVFRPITSRVLPYLPIPSTHQRLTRWRRSSRRLGRSPGDGNTAFASICHWTRRRGAFHARLPV